MKTVQQKLRWPVVTVSIALLALMFSSCSKVKSDSDVANSTSDMAVIDVSPTAPALDFYVDGQIVNSGPITYGGGLQYFVCYAGTRHVAFYQSGTATGVAADTATVAPNKAYTLVFSNLPSTPDITLIHDNITAPATGAATIRLINASPDAGSVDFGIKGKSLLASNIPYRSASSFISVSVAASLTDTIQVYQTGTSNVLQTLPVPVQQGGVFTVYLYGFASQTAATEKLGAGWMENTLY